MSGLCASACFRTTTLLALSPLAQVHHNLPAVTFPPSSTGPSARAISRRRRLVQPAVATLAESPLLLFDLPAACSSSPPSTGRSARALCHPISLPPARPARNARSNASPTPRLPSGRLLKHPSCPTRQFKQRKVTRIHSPHSSCDICANFLAFQVHFCLQSLDQLISISPPASSRPIRPPRSPSPHLPVIYCPPYRTSHSSPALTAPDLAISSNGRRSGDQETR